MQSIHKIILVGVVALMVGGLVGYQKGMHRGFSGGDGDAFGDRDRVAKEESRKGMMRGGMSEEMMSMLSGLAGKTGDAFDKAFLTEMDKHHKGAIDMSEAAIKNAERQEIKDMAQNIITAQKAEMEQMKRWQEEWYGTGEPVAPTPAPMPIPTPITTSPTDAPQVQ